MQEGPIEKIIPEIRVVTCQGCNYLKTKLVRSGREPKYSTNCLNDSNPWKGSGVSSDIYLNDNNLPIPGPWCPFIKKQNEHK